MYIYAIDPKNSQISSSDLITFSNPSAIVECMIQEMDGFFYTENDEVVFESTRDKNESFVRVVEPIRQFPALYYSRKSAVNYSSWN